ncbi:hypothetical protein CM15mP99_1410 [bacterium]|nr:MAG: hypothetical protein CM15mP99_1410 [bacterium]
MARNRFFDKIIPIFSVYFFTCNDKSETNSSFVVAELDTAITTIGEPVKYSFLIQKPENKIIKTNKLDLKNSYEIDSLGFENNDNFIKKTFQVTFWDTGQFILPSLEIEVMSDDSIFEYSFTSDSLSVEVISVKSKIPSLDSISNGELLPIRDPVQIKIFPFFIIVSILILIIISLLIVKVWRSRSLLSEKENNNQRIFQDPISFSLDKINTLEKDIHLKSDFKDIYVKISAIIRNFMENYYYVKALEMTTKEINDNKSLFNLNEKNFTDLLNILKFSDMAKYAKKKKDLDFIKKDLVTIRNILKSIKESNNIS